MKPSVHAGIKQIDMKNMNDETYTAFLMATSFPGMYNLLFIYL